VYSSPFLYFHTASAGIFVCVQLLIVAYYGLLAIGLQIEK